MYKTRKSKSFRILATIDITDRESQFFPNGRGNLRFIAAVLGVSSPTARKILETAYPGRVVFRRGRTGGTHLLPKGAVVVPEPKATPAPVPQPQTQEIA